MAHFVKFQTLPKYVKLFISGKVNVTDDRKFQIVRKGLSFENREKIFIPEMDEWVFTDEMREQVDAGTLSYLENVLYPKLEYYAKNDTTVYAKRLHEKTKTEIEAIENYAKWNLRPWKHLELKNK